VTENKKKGNFMLSLSQVIAEVGFR